jgi:hypothetical protein
MFQNNNYISNATPTARPQNPFNMGFGFSFSFFKTSLVRVRHVVWLRKKLVE